MTPARLPELDKSQEGVVRCGTCPWVVAVLPDKWVRELLGHWARAHDKGA